MQAELDFNPLPGFEGAHASYAPHARRVYISEALLLGPPHECAWYLLHELRHAWQYQHPERLPALVRLSLNYVIQYDGVCWKRTDRGWQQASLPGDEASWLDLYTNQPHEVDANDAAYALLYGLVSASEREPLEQLRRFWIGRNGTIPKEQMASALQAAYRHIDSTVAGNAP